MSSTRHTDRIAQVVVGLTSGLAAAFGQAASTSEDSRAKTQTHATSQPLQRTGTKMLAYGSFLARLHAQGRERGTAWLAAHAADVGRRSTLDVEARFG